ncbi:MAG: regulatory iron-sulfur-containing complex subunit RicT [Phycisphaeraceae bacterium]
MAGTITPLPIMLEEAEDRKIYENLEAPKTIVVRYGYQRLVAELDYDGEAKPGCGSKMVIRTKRGVELGEMLTSTCPNAGCSKSVTRKEMLAYIQNSGGKDYPFTTEGKVLRVATVDDLNEQARLDGRKTDIIKTTKRLIAENNLAEEMRLVDVELLLGGERMLFYYTAENRIDFRELVKQLAAAHQTRIEMVQVNAREEARIAADYEKCGQHCCCKQFLKVLKPVSMRSAKVQKATLDPMKISGRCGRLMCCLRYEDETYSDLKKRLPHRKTVVETDDGIGIVLDTQILTQLALVQVGVEKPAAYPVENLRILDKEEAKAWEQQQKEAAANAPRPRPRNGGGDGGGRDSARSTSAGPRPRPQAAPQGQGQANGDGDSNGQSEAAAVPSRGYSNRQAGKAGGGQAATEPRRPSPGKPVADAEVESREDADAREPQAPQAQAGDTGAADGGDTTGSEGGTTGEGNPGGGRRRRRRRRRRGRRGGSGGSGGGGGAGDSGGA